jgi:hypothetical protein
MNCGQGGEEVGCHDGSAGAASATSARTARAHLFLALARRLERDGGRLGAAELRERVVGAAPLKVDLRAAARGRVRRARDGDGRASRGSAAREAAARWHSRRPNVCVFRERTCCRSRSTSATS